MKNALQILLILAVVAGVGFLVCEFALAVTTLFVLFTN